jgi:DNA primase
MESARIEDVVGDFLNLKRRGANYIANCPFHGEKTPSFIVSPAKGIYKCFGCGAAGNSVKFVMEHEKISYPEALRYVAKKYNIEIEESQVRTNEQQAEQQLYDSLYIINQFAADHFQSNLLMTDEGRSVGLSYFKDRHLNDNTIQKFGLGYSIERNDALLNEARQKAYPLELLKELGLASDRYGRDADFFRARVMFPIHNTSGKIVAFAGRTLLSDKKIPKYVNSPETPIYHKSQVLYGLYWARNDIRKKDECWLVEGYLDVISLVQAGIENVVASSGTSLTQEQIKLIRRYTENIVILYDGDPAGINAALRGMELIIEEGLNVRIVLLPDGHDPDTYLYAVGRSALEQYVQQNAKDFVLFKTQLHLSEIDKDPIKKTVLLKDIISTIAKVQDAIKRALYVRECSRLFELDEQIVITELNKVKVQQKQKQQNVQSLKPTNANNKPSTNPPPDFIPTHDDLLVPDFGIDEYDIDNQSLANLQQTAPQSTKGKNEIAAPQGRDFLEKDIVRVLLEYGEREMQDDIPVAAYLVVQLQQLPFENAICSQILDEYYQALQKGDMLNIGYFIAHPQPNIAQLCAQLLATPYELSQNWEQMHGIILSENPFRYKDEIIDLLNRYKLFYINLHIKTNQNKIKELQKDQSSEGINQLIALLGTQNELLSQRKALSKVLGVEILK